jgi:hypothetical protein
MDEALRRKFDELSEKIIDVSAKVTNLIEAEDQPLQDVDACNAAVAAVADVFTGLFADVPESHKEQVERTYGRRVTDLRRQAAKLPQKSTGRAARVIDPANAGWGDYYRRADPGVNSRAPEQAGSADRLGSGPGHRVGGDVESWCGPCGGLTNHTIIAVVGGGPKQVICEACGGRHGYRTTPARKKEAVEGSSSVRGTSRATREQVHALRKEETRLALQKELAAATDVRAFAPRQRYKVGEIIQHPDHGRGKIENVLKGSLLVRFRDGLKSVNNP